MSGVLRCSEGFGSAAGELQGKARATCVRLAAAVLTRLELEVLAGFISARAARSKRPWLS
eukprot:12206477-Alexandrium_andersonii.AAC.1